MQLQNFFAQDVNGNIVPGAVCTLYLAGTTTLATGLQDKTGSPIGNPFSADSNGLAAFAAPQGVYDLKMISGLITNTIQIQFIDVAQVSADAASASASAASALASKNQVIVLVARFIPPSATNPTTRPDGSALQTGDTYFNTSDFYEYVYVSTDWRVSQTRNFASAAALMASPGFYDGEVAYLRGWNASLPSVGAGEVIWNATSTNIADSGKVYAVTGVTTGRWVRPVRPMCPTDYGAFGNNVNDDTSAVQRCISSNSVVMASSRWNFRTTSTITSNSQAQIIDLKMAAISLDDTTLTADILLVGGDASVKRTGVTIVNSIFGRKQAATAGAAIHLKNTGIINIKDVRIFGDSKVFNGIVNESGIINNIKDCYVDNCINYQIYTFGIDSGAGRSIDTTITGCRVEGGLNGICTWDYTEGFFLKNNIIFNTQAFGLAVDASSDAAGLVSFKIQNTDFDSCGNTCLYLDKVNNWQITDSWFASGARGSSVTICSINIGPSASSGVIAGNQIYAAAGKTNMRIDGSDIAVSGNLINGGADGIILGSTIQGVNIEANNIGSFTDYGINAFSNPTGGWTESGNNFSPASGGIAVGNSGSNCIYGRSKGGFNASVTYDPPSVSANSATSTDVTLASAQLGDMVMVSFSTSLGGMYLVGSISVAGQVHVEFRNPTSSAIDLASGTLRVSVIKMR